MNYRTENDFIAEIEKARDQIRELSVPTPEQELSLDPQEGMINNRFVLPYTEFPDMHTQKWLYQSILT